MNRDKQIEEIARDMCEYYYEGTCYQDKKPCDCKCEIFTDAQYLYGKGYRKASEVAREIFAEIEKTIRYALDIIPLSYKDNENTIELKKECYTDFLEYIAELKKKYESEGEG